jgi:hypothetical protein
MTQDKPYSILLQCSLWGDYGNTLISGFARRELPGNPLLLQRTGPFLPPISFPYTSLEAGRVIVSDAFRSVLELRRFSGVSFRNVVKERIVKLDWHLWNLDAADPKKYPSGGEPGNYVLNKRHDPKAAMQMRDAWELRPPIVPMYVNHLEDPRGGFLNEFVAYTDLTEFPPLFHTNNEYAYIVANSEVRDWLEQQVGKWVKFGELRLAPLSEHVEDDEDEDA